MIIEDVECNVWHQHYVEGLNSNNTTVLNTSWAYEFVTESPQVQVYVTVPQTLDVYEARLYLMFDPTAANSSVLNGVPLAWEPGLYGNITSTDNSVGGYNLESTGYRGVAYASCEFYGRSMFLNFTSPFVGKNLYHLVFIGEKGYGTVDFLVKTEFNNTSLKPSVLPKMVCPGDDATISYTSNSSALRNATLSYSTDSWKTVNSTDMDVSNRTCTVIIPKQAAGTTVDYEVQAFDFLENALAVNGSYSVKYDSTLSMTQVPHTVAPGQNFTVVGHFTPETEGIPITVYLTTGNETKEETCSTLTNGTFTAEFQAETVGDWIVSARFDETNAIRESESPPVTVQIEKPIITQYSYYILGAMGATIAVGMGFFLKKSRS
jgi:hypothetical protein